MISTTTAEDAQYIADNLGDDEICVRLWGPQEASRLAYLVATTSPLSWVIYSRSGEPVAMFGAFPDDLEQFGHAWLFSTEKVKKSARELIQGTSLGIAISRKYWPELRIDAEPRTESQARFLEHIGFRQRTVEVRDGEMWTELVQ